MTNTDIANVFAVLAQYLPAELEPIVAEHDEIWIGRGLAPGFMQTKHKDVLVAAGFTWDSSAEAWYTFV